MVRFRLHSLLLTVAVISVICCIAHFVWHVDDPVAVVVVSDDATIEFTQETALALTASALRKVGLEPVSPKSYGRAGDPEPFVGRNALPPKDEVSVLWNVRGGSYPSCTVTLEREQSSVSATISEHWL